MKEFQGRIAAVLAFAVLAGCAVDTPAPVAEAKTLAPSGKLRAGYYPGSPTSLIRDASGERGVGFDLGRELAKRLGVPFEPVVMDRNAQVLEALKAGQVDVTLTNATPARMKDMDFTPPLFQVEQGYLVPPNSKLASADDIDRPGILVGVSEGSTSQSVLPRELRNARVVTAPTLKAAIEMLASGKIHAFATNKAILFEMSDELPGSKVLPGRWGVENFALGIPKGRGEAMPFLRRFADEVKAAGLVGRAIERAGLRGTVAAQ